MLWEVYTVLLSHHAILLNGDYVTALPQSQKKFGLWKVSSSIMFPILHSKYMRVIRRMDKMNYKQLKPY